MILGTGFAKPQFFAVDTFTAISFSAVGLLPLCVGLAVVTISGSGLDLSIGIVSSISVLMCAQLYAHGDSTLQVILMVLVFGACFGAFNGALIVGLGLDPVVTTLATNFVGIGVVGLQSIVLSMPAESALRSFSFGSPLGVTNLFWVSIALLVVVDVFLRRTRPGRHVLAVGGNPVAASRQGISRSKVRFSAFTFSGFCASAGGVMFAGASDLVRAEISAGRAFQAISAVLLAGIMLAGGRGRVLALGASVLVIVTIPTSIVTLGATGAWALVVQGAVLGIALAIDGGRARRSDFV
jgi:ribose transport system permease protein